MARRIAGVAALALLFVLMAATCASGRNFYVGGRAGWAPNPAEPFNAWAERNRFQVNDTLVFRYSKGADAVLVVSQGHYDACNATQPALRLDGGDSRFVFHSSGPYFFISPDAARCRAGERLIVVVLAVRDGGGSGDGTSSSPPPKPSASPAPPPKSTSSSPPPPGGAAPAPRALPAPPPKSASPSTRQPSSPPPVATPAPHALPTPPPPPPHPVPGKNASSPSRSPVPSPAPAPAPGTNGTSTPPPSPSSAAAFRGGFLACLLIGGAAAILV